LTFAGRPSNGAGLRRFDPRGLFVLPIAAPEPGIVLTEPESQRDLDTLGARVLAAQARHAPTPHQVASGALASGTRYALEIAVATMVGGAIGWQLDRWLGSRPWLAIVFLLLGLAAGFMNLLRAVNREAAALARDDTANAGKEGDT
jgi:ATP synthase protein I